MRRAGFEPDWAMFSKMWEPPHVNFLTAERQTVGRKPDNNASTMN